MLGNKTVGYTPGILKQTWLLAPKMKIIVVIYTEDRYKGSFRNIASYLVKDLELYHNSLNCDGLNIYKKIKLLSILRTEF
jgi:hypothetical protein